MSLQSDKWIIKMAKEKAMISPFEDKQIREGKISFGVSSYGYDARVSNEFKIFTNVNSEIVDPKNFTSKWCPHPELNWKLILTMDVLYHLTMRAFFNYN